MYIVFSIITRYFHAVIVFFDNSKSRYLSLRAVAVIAPIVISLNKGCDSIIHINTFAANLKTK